MNTNKFKVKELSTQEINDVNGGGETAARVMGRAVGLAIGFPFSGLYYAGKDLNWW